MKSKVIRRGIFLTFLIGFQALSIMSWADPEIWVDDDFNAGTPGWGVTRFDTVTSGIANVDPTGTVHVAAGTYTEDITVNQSLTLDGESSETVILQPVGAQLDPYFFAPTHLLITAGNVLIQNVQLAGNESVCDEGIFIQDCDNVTILRCNIHNYNSDAAYSLEGTGTDVNTDIHFLGNYFHHIRENNNNIAWNTFVLCYENTTGLVADNTITSCNVMYGFMNWIDDGSPNLPAPPEIRNNIIENILEPLTAGSFRANRAIVAGDPATITGNTIRNANQAIQVQLVIPGSAAHDGDVLVQNNTAYDLRPPLIPGSCIGIYLDTIDNQADRNVLVADNILEGVNGDPALGTGLFARLTNMGNITWRNNHVTGYGMGADFRQNSAPTLFINNSLDFAAGLNPPATDELGIRLREGSLVTMVQNDVQGFDYGLVITDTNSSGTLTQNTLVSDGIGIRVTNNGILYSAGENFIFGNSGDGIQVAVDTTPGAIGSVCKNDILGNGGLAVNNSTGVNINASANWLGGITPAQVASRVSANVDYSPWLVSSADTSGLPGFQGDFTSLSVDDNSPQAPAIGYLTEAVNYMAFPGTLTVYAGNYNDGIDITQSFTLNGPNGAAATIIDATATGRPLSSGLDVPLAIRPSGPNVVVTVDGFTFTNCDIGVDFEDLGGNPGDQLILTNCVFNNIDAAGTAVIVDQTQADIENNVINGIGAGIQIVNSSNAQLRVNTIRNGGSVGLRVDNGQVIVENNTITNNNIGVLVNGGTVDLGYGPYSSVGLNHIENNTLLNLDNAASADMKAEMNWWGSIVFNTVEISIDHKPDNIVQGFVDFIPFKGITDPDPVWVGRGYSSATAGWGYDHFDNIREGDMAVANSGTINLANGTYDAEPTYPIVFAKGEKLYGASSTGAIIRNPASTVNSQTGTGSVLFEVRSDNVVISNVTIDGDNNPLIADDFSVPELGHGDSDPDNDVNALTGVRLNPGGSTSTAENLRLGNVIFKNLYRGVEISGRPGQADELSRFNIVDNCAFDNIGARNLIFKNGAGAFLTSAEAEITSSTFSRCDIGIMGQISFGSNVTSALSAHQNRFTDNYCGILFDGTPNNDPDAGLTTFDPDDSGPIAEGIADNVFDASPSFRSDNDGWDPASADFIDHFNLDVSNSGSLFGDPSPPTSVPDTPIGILSISETDPVIVTLNHINNMRRGIMALSERGVGLDDGTMTILTNWIIGPGTDPSFDAVGVLGLNRQIFGNATAEDDFAGDVKFNLYDTYVEGAVDLVRLQEEPVPVLGPTTFYITMGGSPANRNVLGLTRGQAINLGFFNLTGGGMQDDVNATYNDFLVNRYSQIEDVVYHKQDDSFLGLVIFIPAKRVVSNVALTANPSLVDDYFITVDLTAVVRDGFGDFVDDGIPVVFDTDFGTLGTLSPVLTAAGEAQNTLVSDRDGIANVAAVADGCATGTAIVTFDRDRIEPLYYYPFTNYEFEGWRVGDPQPGTYIPTPVTNYYMAPTTNPPGQIGILNKYNVNVFGYWHLKPEYAIPYLPNKVYRARYRMRTDQTDPFKAPLARLRWNNVRFSSSCLQQFDKGLNAPSYLWTDYYSYYYPPDLTGLPAQDQGLFVSFDLVDFTDIQSGSLYLDEVEVERFSVVPPVIGTSVLILDSQSDFSGWTGYNLPQFFGPVTVGSNTTGLYLESGTVPSPPTGMTGLPDYGVWECNAQTSTISYEPNKLYRAIFTLETPDLATQQTVARIRLRMQNGGSDCSNVYEVFPLGPTEYYNHMPSPAGTEYSVFMESPMVFYTGAELFKNKVTLAIDVVDGKTTEYGRAYLTRVEVKYYDIP